MATDNVLYIADRAVIDGVQRGSTAVLAHDGMIIAVDSPAVIAADPRSAGATVMRWTDRAMVPGTVNAHDAGHQRLRHPRHPAQ